MKKIFYLGVFLCSILANSQSLGYNDISVLFSEEDANGTARSRAMSGAFGALGGDLSAIEVNPAGTAVFLKSEASFSLQVRNQSIESNYYGSKNNTDDVYTGISQAGLVFVFDSGKSTWKRTSIAINYSLAKDFDNTWFADGNSGFATFIYDGNYTDDGDDTNDVIYDTTDGQRFENYTSGQNEKVTISLATQYNDDLYFGISLISNDINLYQSVVLKENNNDGAGNTNAAQSKLRNDLLNVGSGIAFSLGVISKPVDNLRLGLAYQSSTWYELSEEFDDGMQVTAFDYRLKTPSKLTGSFAYIFNKNGLVSLDYSHKNYKNIKLRPSVDFADENQAFTTDLRGTSELRLGTEWRVKKISFRGGFHMSQSPYKNALTTDNLKGFSLGLGYNFGNTKLDFSYENSNRTDVYNFYPQYSNVNAAELNFNASKIAATLVFKI